MASNINANNIDGTYPIAGVDNDSQGFRTNFTNIKTNLTYTKSELEDIQSKVLLKSPLTGTTLNNNMSGSTLSGAEIYNFRETEVDLATTSGTLTLDHSLAHNYTVSTNGSVSLSFTNFPLAGKVGRIRLKINVQSDTYTMTLPAAVTLGTDGINGYSNSIISFAYSGVYIYEFLTDDQGASIHIQDLSRPRIPTATNTEWHNTSGNFLNYSYQNVSSNFNIAALNSLYIDSTSTLSIGNVYLPNLANDGQIIAINTNNAISTLHISSNAGALILGNVTSLASNTSVAFQYIGDATPSPKWFRINKSST
jgi:hypothetical protein